MTDVLPLNGRVARALGCRPEAATALSVYGKDSELVDWFCTCDNQEHGDGASLYDYTLDWAATGPLIEEYGFAIAPAGAGRWVVVNDQVIVIPADNEGCYGADTYFDDYAFGATPCEAVCNLIVALAAAGKLERR